MSIRTIEADWAVATQQRGRAGSVELQHGHDSGSSARNCRGSGFPGCTVGWLFEEVVVVGDLFDQLFVVFGSF